MVTLLVSRGDELVGATASSVGEASAVRVRVGDGTETNVAKGVFVIAGSIVAVGAEAMPQNWASRSPLEAEYRVELGEKFSEITGCLTVLSGQE